MAFIVCYNFSMKKSKKLLKKTSKELKEISKNAAKEKKQVLYAKKMQSKEEGRLKKKSLIIKRNTISTWLTLDNAATIYPSIREEKWDFVFRLSAVLNELVDINTLQQAVDDITPRFPSFFVKLKKGFFWNYFETQEKRLLVEKEDKFPCSRFSGQKNKHIIRVLVYNHRISVECFHAIADGKSVLKFLNSLLKRYFELQGTKLSSSIGCLDYLDKPRREELADSFFEFEDDSKKLKHKEKKAYYIKGTEEEYGVINSTIGIMSVGKVKQIAKDYNAKLFEFIIANLAFVIAKRAKTTDCPVKISVPIDLRQFFESESLRNFAGYINIEVPCRKYESVTEVLPYVQSAMEEITKDRMQSFINSNVAMQKNFFIKVIPLFIKNFFIKLFFKAWGESYQTLALSNLGMVKVPEEFGGLVDYYEFNVGRPKYNAKSAGLISFGDKLVFTMSSKIKENTTERDFFVQLAKLGAEVTINTNRRDLYE